jgi:ferredoxin
MIQVSVDLKRCQGHARCFLIYPEVFGLDEEGHVVLRHSTVADEHREGVLKAVENCPEQAISAGDHLAELR